MDKVISFKVDESIYDKMKATGLTFRQQLEPLLIDCFNDNDSIPLCIPIEKPNEEQLLYRCLDSIKRRVGGSN